MERLARDQIAKAILRKFKFKVATLPAGAFQWLFFLSAHVSPPVTHLAFNRIAAKLLGLTPDEGAIARGEQAMPAVNLIMEAGFLAIGFKGVADHPVTTPRAVARAFNQVGLRVVQEARLRPIPVVSVYFNWLLEKVGE